MGVDKYAFEVEGCCLVYCLLTKSRFLIYSLESCYFADFIVKVVGVARGGQPPLARGGLL